MSGLTEIWDPVNSAPGLSTGELDPLKLFNETLDLACWLLGRSDAEDLLTGLSVDCKEDVDWAAEVEGGGCDLTETAE